jgi:hypothetical protein
MHKKYLWIGTTILMALALLIGIALFVNPVSAAYTTSSLMKTAPPSPDTYIIALSTVLPEQSPPNLTIKQATEHARGLTYHQAQPILAELRQLRAQGKITRWELRPDLHAVIVEANTDDVLESLSRQHDVAAVLPYEAGAEAPVCAVAAAQALPDQILGMSQIDISPKLSPQATDPSIGLYASPGNTWTYIQGRTTYTATQVAIRILRNGHTIAEGSTSSSSSGYYSFYPTWQQCPSYGYNWTLQPGDVVEVTVAGNTVSTVVAAISASVDPNADSVTGQTDPGRSTQVNLYAYDSDPCMSTRYSQTATIDEGGHFSVDFSGQVDFDGRAYSTIYARDANGNSTYATFYAHRIHNRFESSYIYGYLPPNVSFTAVLSRSGDISSTFRGQSGANGYYSAWFTDTVQPGDEIQVTGEVATLEYTATTLDMTVDHTTDQATGGTGVGRTVRAWFYKRTWGNIATACSYSSECASATANGSGDFALTTTLDLARGDYVNASIYDAAGNYQYASDYPAPAIAADLTEDQVFGYWGDPAADYLTVTLKNITGTVKAVKPDVWVNSWDSGFDTWYLGATIVPSDTIEVTDGVTTETMTVQNLTARLDGDSGHLAGVAYDDHLLAKLWDFRREDGYWWGYCAETDVTDATYDLTFSNAQVGGRDYAEVWNTGPDDHYTYRYPRAFTVQTEIGEDDVWGYTEISNTPFTVTLERNSNVVVTYTGDSEDNGWYDVWLDQTTPVTITQGDTVTVQTWDGDSASVPIPALTANVDGADNEIYGHSPADEPVEVSARRYYQWGWYGKSQVVTADAAGDYSAGFDDEYWYRYGHCYTVDVGHPCIQPNLTYHNADGHAVQFTGPRPTPVGPDAYETDDSYTNPSNYAGVQSHTFHTVTDTDWVSFTVSAEDVSNTVPYRIETFNLGWGMATQVNLWIDGPGSALLHSWTGSEDGGKGVAVLWTPTLTGTHWLEIRPPSPSYAAYCDAVYDLQIMPLRGIIYLPLVIRNG